jgi:GT2 family glycosyltransferase
MLTHQPPPAPNSPAWRSAVQDKEPPEENGTLSRREGLLRRYVRSLLKADEIEIPYDEDWPVHPIPRELQEPTVGTRRAIAGHTMTVRREDALAEPFEEMLERYSSGEDTDMSYRLSRRGPLLTALDAWMYHPPIAGTSLSPFLLATLQATNQIVLQRKNATNTELAKARLKRTLRRRVLIEATKDAYYRNVTAPRTRAFLLALRRIDSIFDMSVEELTEVYPDLQREWFRKYSNG